MSIKKNKVTVAIPVRNGSDYLAETLNFLKNASISEILISNNFSTDNTESIVKDFQNVRVIKPPTPLKMAENWNFVTRHVNTEYFRLVSHDDFSFRFARFHVGVGFGNLGERKRVGVD